MAITTEEWKEECGIADETTALQLPNCRDVFQGYASVPGQALCCPQVWVVLVECIGLLLEIRVQRHPTWEQTDSIRECSRYYPTMRLLLTHHDTSLRRLQNVGGLQAEHVDEAVRLFSTPIQVQECTEGMDYVMTPPIVAAECGPEAAVLCTLVEDVLFTHKSAHTLILTARFNFSRQNQAAHLNRLRSSLRALEQAHDALGECESGLMRVKHVQNAARNSLADVDLRPIRDLISLSFPLCEMFNRDLTDESGTGESPTGLGPKQLVAVGILQVAAALVLTLDEERGEDESTPMFTTEPLVAEDLPSDEDLRYWSSLEAKEGLDLIFALPPFKGNPDATWADMLSEVGTADGRSLLPKFPECVPLHRFLKLKHDVLLRAAAAWEGEAAKVMFPWEKRKWTGLRSVTSFGHSHCHLIKPLLFIEASLELYAPFCVHDSMVEKKLKAEALVAELRASEQCRESVNGVPSDAAVADKTECAVAMKVTGRDSRSFKVSLSKGSEVVEISVPPRRSQTHPTEMLPHYGPLACATDVSGVALTDDQILWVFRSLDKESKGCLDREEAIAFYRSIDLFDGVSSAAKTNKFFEKLVGKGKKIGMYEFKTMLLHLAKR